MKPRIYFVLFLVMAFGIIALDQYITTTVHATWNICDETPGQQPCYGMHYKTEPPILILLFLTIGLCVLLIPLALFAFRKRSWGMFLLFGTIIGAAISRMIDMLIRGFGIDYIHFTINGNQYMGATNLVDVISILGIVTIALWLWMLRKEIEKQLCIQKLLPTSMTRKFCLRP